VYRVGQIKRRHLAFLLLAIECVCKIQWFLALTKDFSLSLHFNCLFSRWTWVSWCLLKQRMMEVVVTSRAKLQSNHHHQHPDFLQAGCPSCRPTNSVKALKEKISYSMLLLTPSSPGVFQLCLWPLIVPGYLTGGLPCLSSAHWCQYPFSLDVNKLKFTSQKCHHKIIDNCTCNGISHTAPKGAVNN